MLDVDRSDCDRLNDRCTEAPIGKSVNDPTDERIEAIAAAIEDYLERYPHARDTARGIQEWWLPSPLRDRPFAEVQRALWRLVGRGRVVGFALSNNTTLFAKAPPSPGPRRGPS